MTAKSATEESVGITMFVNNLSGMTGIIKHKYSDFHVHEIDLDGNIVYLKSLEPLPESKLPEGFEEWYESETTSPFFTFKVESDQQRAQILDYSNLRFEEDEDGTATVEKMNKRRPRQYFYTFVCCKENKTGPEMVQIISKKLGVEKKRVGFAGIKDKRAITTQRVSVMGRGINQLKNLKNISDYIKCGQFVKSSQPVKLGDLKGNHFTLVLRDAQIPGCTTVEEMKEELGKKMRALNEKGFINYYGLQRFGTTSIGTHVVGRAILRQEWDKVIKLLLSPAEGDKEEVNEVKRKFLEDHDARKAIEKMPYCYQTERTIYSALIKNPELIDNPKLLFKTVDLRQRKLYVHAYQSFLWNTVASARVKKYGLKVVAGDYVESGDKYVRVLKGEESKYTFFDVVIPLPTNGCIDKEIVGILKKDGIDEKMFVAQKELNAKGDMRKLYARPVDIDYDIIEHDDRDVELIDSDIDKILGRSNSVNHVKGGKYRSAVVEFSLESSQYATMCMRELMKRSTEWWADSSMSNGSEGSQRKKRHIHTAESVQQNEERSWCYI